ncbi:Ig-like domain-containing protein, partial [Halomonas sp. AOP7-C1-8]
NLDTVATITVSLDDVNSDNVAAAPISGSTTGVEAGQTVTLVISDGTTEVTVRADVDADGNYETTADLSTLNQGELSVTATVEDQAGNEATATDDA